jgi:uncharacterized membrane protein YfcA
MSAQIALFALASGGLVGGVLGLIGGGGSILALPLLVYVVGVADVHQAVGTSAIAVALNALASLSAHARTGNVRWPCAAVFTVAGIIGAIIGSSLGKLVDGHLLLLLFGVLMIGIGISMFLRNENNADPNVRLTAAVASSLVPRLLAAGLGVGLLSGFFGIGGGFLIVPGLILATAMPLSLAIGTSLVAVSAFGLTTAANYAVSGLVDWPLAALVVAGGVGGAFLGSRASASLAGRKRTLSAIFAAIVIATGLFIAGREGFAMLS